MTRCEYIDERIYSVAPASEPVDAAYIKAHTRVDHSTEDTYIGYLIEAARAKVEEYTCRQLMSATMLLYRDGFPSGTKSIVVPFPPLSSVSSVAYVDANGDNQTLSTDVYGVDTNAAPGEIYLKYDQEWPTTRLQRNAVTVTYVAGYASVAAVPEAAKLGIAFLVSHWYEQREPMVAAGGARSLPYGVEAIVAPLRVKRFV